MAKFISNKIKKKSAARLAAVQATYMIEFGQLPVDEVVRDFVNGEVGRYVIEEDSNGYEVFENMVEVEEMDAGYFAALTRDVHKNKEMIEKSLARFLKEGWQLSVLTERCVLCCFVQRMSWDIQLMSMQQLL